MPRWVTICQDCWYEEFPDQYLPDNLDYVECSNCGQHGLGTHVNPRDLERNAE
jgi:NMD protein affecting ribosome stability and mRNA decay